MRTFKSGAAVAALILSASGASAATVQDVTVQNVFGQWVSAGPNNAFGVEYKTDPGRTQVLWGKAPRGGRKSGYEFDGLIPPPVETTPGNVFELGVFTHFNNPIFTNPGRGFATAISEATLRVDFDVRIGQSDFAFSRFYTFNHDETPNLGTKRVCAHGGKPGQRGVNANGCADRVTATLNDALSESVRVDGYEYNFDISGFRVGDETFSEFLTKEKADNSAILLGSYSVSQVPLPAAGWMLLAGIGGLAAVKRRKARA